MADNVAITAGTGTTIAADDVGGGVLVQRVKATWGPDGTANDADVSTGKPLPIQVRSATGLIPFGEPTDAKNSATDTTSVAMIPLLKQISASAQALVTAETGVAHDAAASAVDPVLVGGYASAAAPSDVSADTDAVRAWLLRNGATAVNLTAAGALIPGDATHGLRVQHDSGSVASGAFASGSVADGAMVTLGAKADAKSTATDTTSITLMQVAKQISASAQALATAMSTNALAGEYETVAASQTDQAIGATGATGDYLSHVVVIPAVAACGLVTIKDNTTAIISFVGGGTTAMPSVAPFVIPVGLYSASGAWKITTGANVSCVAVGNFT